MGAFMGVLGRSVGLDGSDGSVGSVSFHRSHDLVGDGLDDFFGFGVGGGLVGHIQIVRLRRYFAVFAWRASGDSFRNDEDCSKLIALHRPLGVYRHLGNITIQKERILAA